MKDEKVSSTIYLKAKGLTRRWGGLVAVNAVDIELALGEIHAVIGTNGAGKSTLINLISGEIPLSSGSVELLGQDVTQLSQPTRAQMGLGKSYQRNTIFLELTVLENCRLSAQSKLQKPWQFWQNGQNCSFSNEYALHILDKTGLSHVLERPAGLLSHGQKRQLEVAMCLATDPKVLLLDEPLAGMGADETDRMLNFLSDLRKDHAMMLVEHDMDAVFKVADVITVMVNGSVIAKGTPDQVRNDPQVQSAYLGAESS
jgi:branched-chain amino acid transport system ATP-binding protein